MNISKASTRSSSSKHRLLIAGVVASVAVFLGVRAMADNAYNIETSDTVGSTVTYDGNGAGGSAIITAILSQPGTVFGQGAYSATSRTYFYDAFTAADGPGGADGSLEIFTEPQTNSVNATPGLSGSDLAGGINYVSPNPGYVPQVGDAISVTGPWSPFDAIPELGGSGSPPKVTNMGALSQGNAVPATPSFTIPQILANPNFSSQSYLPLAQNVAGYFSMISNVTISGESSSVFTNGNMSLTLTDSGGHTMTMFYYYTSYSSDGAMAGALVPTQHVNVYGFADSFSSTSKVGSTIVTNWSDEFVPVSFSATVPEPSSCLLAGVGLLSLLAVMRRRRS